MKFSHLKYIYLYTLLLIVFFSLCNSVQVFSLNRAIRLVSSSDLNHNSTKIGKYTAIIIGINDYSDDNIQDLDTAVNDAKAISDILSLKYGFQDISLLTDKNATRVCIDRVFRNKINSLNLNDSLVIYFAGHGDIDRELGGGWWLPSDAKGGYPGTYIDNTIIQKYIKAMRAKHVLLISDSCYSGTLFGISRKAPPIITEKYYVALYNEKSRWGLTSGNITPVSDMGSNNHSIFAYQLIKMLNTNKQPYVTPRQIYDHIAPIICNNAEQKPMCLPIRNTGDQGGEFVFILSEISRRESKYSKKLGNMKNIYISHVNFIYTDNKMCVGQFEELMNQTVIKAINQVKEKYIFLKHNHNGHKLEFTEKNCERLNNIYLDPNLCPDDKFQEIKKKIMEPAGIDAIISGYYDYYKDVIKFQPFIISKKYNYIEHKIATFRPDRFFCPDPMNHTSRTICTGAQEEVVQLIQELLINLLKLRG